MIHPDIAALSFLLGKWSGGGHGHYPTIDSFDYDETISFTATAKPVIAYQQRTTRKGSGEPLHAEFGYVRLVERAPELVICQVTGLAEAHGGTLEGQRIAWRSRGVTATPGAAVHELATVTRDLEVVGDELRYTLGMAAAGQPLQEHLSATLRRASPLG